MEMDVSGIGVKMRIRVEVLHRKIAGWIEVEMSVGGIGVLKR